MLFLGIALLLVLVGQTILRAHLHGLLYLLYWLTCIVALALAVATALLDILLVRQEARREQLALLHETLIHTSPAHPPPADPLPPSPSAQPGCHRPRSGPGSAADAGKI
jgi:hypothetical protein